MMAVTVELRAGPVRLLAEPATGWVRYPSVGGVEVVRAIYGAVRDRRWGTVPPVIENWRLEQDEDRFRVTFRAVCKSGPIDFRWTGEVAGDADGTITYRFRGVAHGAFLRNRIGLCVLHPLRGVGGAECAVTHTDGTTTTGRFPDPVAPHQPFRDVRSLRYRVAGGPEVGVTFAGEVFETEDQRNWIDGSYKTYGTPLDRPFPVAVQPGDVVEQTATMRVPSGRANPLGPLSLEAGERGLGWTGTRPSGRRWLNCGGRPAACCPRSGRPTRRTRPAPRTRTSPS